MTAKELRIGNQLQYLSGDVFTVSSNTLMLIETWTGSPELLPRGVSLTDERLKRFGFVTLDCEIDYVDWGFPDMRNDFHLLQDGIGSDFPYYFEYEGGDEQKVFIKYVHQLQNLYFALTGEELTFKEITK